jgi:GT2 family glycosyltransferase
MNSNVLAIVVTYNGEGWIRSCLDSLTNGSHSCDILVIDNNSQDATSSVVQNEYPDVKFVQLDANVGFGRANNIGLSWFLEADYNYVLLLNQDAYLLKDTLAVLIEQISTQPSFAALTPIHLAMEGGSLNSQFAFYLDQEQGLKQAIEKENEVKIFQSKMKPAAIWLLSRKCVQTVGGFDPIFFQYGEDDNYYHRIGYHNLSFGLVSSCFAIHTESLNGPSKRSIYQRHRTHFLIEAINEKMKDGSDSSRLSITRFLFLKRAIKYTLAGKLGSAYAMLSLFRKYGSLVRSSKDSATKGRREGAFIN